MAGSTDAHGPAGPMSSRACSASDGTSRDRLPFEQQLSSTDPANAPIGTLRRDVGADPLSAPLEGANLEAAQLEGATLRDAVVSKETRWPDGWDRARLPRLESELEAEREADVGSTADVAQRDEEQDPSHR
jgi:hypothetical protein